MGDTRQDKRLFQSGSQEAGLVKYDKYTCKKWSAIGSINNIILTFRIFVNFCLWFLADVNAEHHNLWCHRRHFVAEAVFIHAIHVCCKCVFSVRLPLTRVDRFAIWSNNLQRSSMLKLIIIMLIKTNGSAMYQEACQSAVIECQPLSTIKTSTSVHA